MGWNSWNCFAGAVDDAKVRSAATRWSASGLMRHGWTYINIDDCWEGQRDADGRIQPNEKFPDMKASGRRRPCQEIEDRHYSSPGPKTCAGFEASWKHEQSGRQHTPPGDSITSNTTGARTKECRTARLPEWPRLMKPYEVMRQALNSRRPRHCLSLCRDGMGQVRGGRGDQVGGNCWRTTGDITTNGGAWPESVFSAEAGL